MKSLRSNLLASNPRWVSSPRITRHSFRRGIVTLEFAMSLPVVLLMFVVIVWIGFSVHALCRVSIDARNDSFHQRFSGDSTESLVFVNDEQLAEGAADEQFHVTPILDDLSFVESSSFVLSNSWDHRVEPLDRSPNIGLAAKSFANAKTASLQNAYAQFRNALGQLSGFGGGIASGIGSAESLVKNAILGQGGVSSGGTDPFNGQTGVQERKDQERAQLTRERTRLREQVDRLDQEILQLESEIEGEEEEEQREKLENRMADLERRKSRVEGELRLVEADLRATN